MRRIGGTGKEEYRATRECQTHRMVGDFHTAGR
jgi:hypothetical protein